MPEKNEKKDKTLAEKYMSLTVGRNDFVDGLKGLEASVIVHIPLIERIRQFKGVVSEYEKTLEDPVCDVKSANQQINELEGMVGNCDRLQKKVEQLIVQCQEKIKGLSKSVDEALSEYSEIVPSEMSHEYNFIERLCYKWRGIDKSAEELKKRLDDIKSGLATLESEYKDKVASGNRLIAEINKRKLGFHNSIGKIHAQINRDQERKERLCAAKNKVESKMHDLRETLRTIGISQDVVSSYVDGNGVVRYRLKDENAVQRALLDKQRGYHNLVVKYCKEVAVLQPPLAELGKDNVNLTASFPTFIVHGHMKVSCGNDRTGELVAPVIYPFPFERPVLAESHGDILALLLRMFFSMPVRSFETIILDQDTAGASVQSFARLSGIGKLMKIITEADEIEAVLKELDVYIGGLVKNDYFRDEISNWAQYNAANQNTPLPYKVVVVFSLKGFSVRSCELLRKLMENGKRCGILFVFASKALATADAGIREQITAMSPLAVGEMESQNAFEKMTRAKFSKKQVKYIPPKLPDTSFVVSCMKDIAEIIDEVAKSPIKTFDEIFPKSELWKGDATDGFEVPIGFDENGNFVNFRIGSSAETLHHAIIGGITGSGKSNLIHVLVHSLCLRYSPDELELYLLDFKDGLEFQKYADSSFVDRAWLPHVRTISVSNDPGYALQMFKFLKAERQSRKRQYGGLGNYVDYRKSGKKLPRIVVVIDEFHKMFEDDNNDEIADEMIDLLKQGRAYGIHLVLATQTLSSLHGIHKLQGMLDQIPIRLVLPCPTGDGGFLDSNDAMTIRKPQCILNENGGMKGQSKIFRHPFIDHGKGEAQKYRKFIETKCASLGKPASCRIFDGTRLPKIEKPETFTEKIRNCATSGFDCHLLLGKKNDFLGSEFFVGFEKDQTDNLLVAGGTCDVGGNIEGADVWTGLCESVIRSLVAQRAQAEFVYYRACHDGNTIIMPANGRYLEDVASGEEVLEALTILRDSQAQNKFLIVEGFEKAHWLMPHEQESRPSRSLAREDREVPRKEDAASVFMSAFSTGTAFPFKVILFMHDFERLYSSCSPTSTSHKKLKPIFDGCPKRIGFNLTGDGMKCLIPDSRKMAKGILYADIYSSPAPTSILPYSIKN